VELPSPDQGPFFAFCALGHPEAFFADLLVAGLPWLGTASFTDHRALSSRDLLDLERQALAAGATALVCTEKDAVKLRLEQPLQMPLWVAEQRVLGAEPLVAYVLERLNSLKAP